MASKKQPTRKAEVATLPVSMAHIARSILLVRDHKVLLDSDLAALYGVETKRLNEQVRRNRDRFPEDFIFELTDAEFENLKSQIATSSGMTPGWGGRRKLPLVYSEHGAIMAATVLNSPRAVSMTIHVVRAFVQFRQALLSNKELARQIAHLERKVSSHDQTIVGILKAIRELMHPTIKKSRPIGFTANLEDAG